MFPEKSSGPKNIAIHTQKPNEGSEENNKRLESTHQDHWDTKKCSENLTKMSVPENRFSAFFMEYLGKVPSVQ